MCHIMSDARVLRDVCTHDRRDSSYIFNTNFLPGDVNLFLFCVLCVVTSVVYFLLELFETKQVPLLDYSISS